MTKPTREDQEDLEEVERVPDARDVFKAGKLTEFSKLVERRLTVTEQIKRLEEARKALDVSLTELMANHDVLKVLYDNRPVSLVQGFRSSLNKEKLLLAGVTSAMIVTCTDRTSFMYLLIGKEKSS